MVAAVSAAVTCVLSATGVIAETERWVVCYGDCPEPGALLAYDVVVLDADRHPPLRSLVERGRTVLAYLSVTQIGRSRLYFQELERAGAILGRHPTWTDAHYLDFRRREWTTQVLDNIVPRALDSGFSGLFLDTLDDAEYLERSDPERYSGMRDAAVQLVQTIRRRFPGIVLMANRGYALMPRLASSLDILLGESVVGTFNPATRTYARQTPADVEWQVNALREARRLNPRLKLFSLDYWDPADSEGVLTLYHEQRARGFVPYISTPLLDTVVEEPQ